MIDIDMEEISKTYMKFALYSRAYQTDKYIKCSFQVENHTFSAFDKITFMYGEVFAHKKTFDDNQPIQLVIKHEDIPRSKFVVHQIRNTTIKTLIKFVTYIQPKITNQKFSYKNKTSSH